MSFDKPALYGRDTWHPPPQKEAAAENVSHNYQLVAIISSVSFFLLLTMAISGSYLFVRYKRLRRFLTSDEIKEFLNGRPGHENASRSSQTQCSADFLKFDPNYDLPMSELSIGMYQQAFQSKY